MLLTVIFACNRPPQMHPMIVPTDIQVDAVHDPWLPVNMRGVIVRPPSRYGQQLPVGTIVHVREQYLEMRRYPDDPDLGYIDMSSDRGHLSGHQVAVARPMDAASPWSLPPADTDRDGRPDALWLAEQHGMIWSDNQEMWWNDFSYTWLVVEPSSGGLAIAVQIEYVNGYGGSATIEAVWLADLAGDSGADIVLLRKTTVPEAGYGGRELLILSGPALQEVTVPVGDPPGASLTGEHIGWLEIAGGKITGRRLRIGEDGLYRQEIRYERVAEGLRAVEGAEVRVEDEGEVRRVREAAERGGYEDDWRVWVKASISPDKCSGCR